MTTNEILGISKRYKGIITNELKVKRVHDEGNKNNYNIYSWIFQILHKIILEDFSTGYALREE